ncbi:hypothetical protein CTAM01_07003 [Colletotrichum tamarilloi]|uniref:Uncharacterized protein n=1 Tax=Colletotrichum tamarilloi TaxID=1209934 RepID=A0ABQ9RAA2_9PEZI|nr:uncharacterized protein CTAM01_07003 [Colletotrichum tamarilloi]KAK1499082.1 hypothetical protein CTAM01_07003 [Colletotrichum tamarilloi]
MQLGYCAANMRRHTHTRQTTTGILTTGEGIERAGCLRRLHWTGVPARAFSLFSIFPAYRVDAPLIKLKSQTGLSVTAVRFVRDAVSSIVDVVCGPDVLPNTRDGKIDIPMALLGELCPPSPPPSLPPLLSPPVWTTRRLDQPPEDNRKAGPCSLVVSPGLKVKGVIWGR